jgi:hypothetical protein
VAEIHKRRRPHACLPSVRPAGHRDDEEATASPIASVCT